MQTPQSGPPGPTPPHVIAAVPPQGVNHAGVAPQPSSEDAKLSLSNSKEQSGEGKKPEESARAVVLSDQNGNQDGDSPDVDTHTMEGTPKKSKLAFLSKFSLASYAIGLGNAFIIPYCFFNTGRGAFLIPLVFCYIFVGIPMLLIEAVVGQYSALHPNVVFSRISPILNSIGGMFSMVTFYRSLYYMPFLSVLLYTAGMAIEAEHKPYETCYTTDCLSFAQVDQCASYWRTDMDVFSLLQLNRTCLHPYMVVFNTSHTIRVGPFTDYYEKVVFDPQNSELSYFMLASLLGGWLIVACLVSFSTKFMMYMSSVIGIIAVLMTIVCFIYTVMQDVPTDLYREMFSPQWSYMMETKTWGLAITVTLYSLSLCDGGVIRLTSYNSFNNNIMIDVIITIVVDLAVTMMHIIIFALSSGYIISELYPNTPDTKYCEQLLINSNDGYILAAFPEFAFRVSSPMVATVMTCIYVVSIVMTSFQSVLASFETLVASIIYRLKVTSLWARMLVGIMLSAMTAGFCVYLITPTGIPLIWLFLDNAMIILTVVAFIEVIALAYFYGYDNFCRNIETMIGWRPTFVHYMEIATWKGITPLLLGSNAVGFFVNYLINLISGNDDVAIATGTTQTIMVLSSLIIVPIYIGTQLLRLKRENRKTSVLFTPAADWGRYQAVIQNEAFDENN